MIYAFNWTTGIPRSWWYSMLVVSLVGGLGKETMFQCWWKITSKLVEILPHFLPFHQSGVILTRVFDCYDAKILPARFPSSV